MISEVLERKAADVVVCGGGAAGFAAAVGAARAGASVALIESQTALGGIWAQAMLTGASDWRTKTALMREFEERWERVTGRTIERDPWGARFRCVAGSFFTAPEWIKVVMEQMVQDSGARIRLHTRVTDVRLSPEGRRIEAVVTESKSGREVWPAKVFIDATGDGDLGALAGCGFDSGRPGSGETQPMSLHALVTGLREDDVFGPGADWPRRPLDEEFRQAALTSSYAHPGMTRVGPGLFVLHIHHAYGVKGWDADDLTRATLEGRAAYAEAVRGLRSLGGIWKDIELAATSPLIGVREGRRLHGLYRVTREDLIAGQRQADAVCRVTFPVDVHATDPKSGKGFSNEGVGAQPYDIPIRALISSDRDNLGMAGRCISGDFIAHASYRVVGNAIATGEAAGCLAALAALDGVALKEVPFTQVLERLSTVV